MKQDKQRANWIMDAALFGGFLTAMALDLTGVALHQWLGIAIAGLAGWHLAAHRGWVKTITARFFGHINGRARLFFFVDAGLAAGLLTISGTGLVISTWASLTLANHDAWYAVHVAASLMTLALLVAKIGLHWRWIVSVARRRIWPRPIAAERHAPVQSPAAAAPLDRRDFVRLMGLVGLGAALASAQILSDRLDAGASAEASQVSTPKAASKSAAACTVRCQRRCSYPGHCRRYVDRNANGRCDLGECPT